MANLIQHRAGFTIVSNVYCRDSSLSLKARGMIVTLLSVDAETWNFSERGLAAIVPDGRAAVRSALQELEGAGYLLREQVTGPDGRWGKTLYHVFEDPRQVDSQIDLGYGGMPRTESGAPVDKLGDSEAPAEAEPVDDGCLRRSEPWSENRTADVEPWFENRTTDTAPWSDFPTAENRTTYKEPNNKKPSIPDHESESSARELEPRGVDGAEASRIQEPFTVRESVAGAGSASAPAAPVRHARSLRLRGTPRRPRRLSTPRTLSAPRRPRRT